MSSGCYIHSVEAVANTVSSKSKTPSFRQYSTTGTIPKEAYDISALHGVKKVAICTRDGLITADPANMAATTGMSLIPTLPPSGNNPTAAFLKNQLETARPLGFMRLSKQELFIIYDYIGCFVDARGSPTRKCGFVRWETKATSWATRGDHIFLISPRFIEIRNTASGRLLEVIEGADVRLVFSGPAMSPQDKVLVAMRKKRSDPQGHGEHVIELAETEPYGGGGPPPAGSPMWSEWDMQ